MESSKLSKIEQKPIIKVFKRKPCDSGIDSMKDFVLFDIKKIDFLFEY